MTKQVKPAFDVFVSYSHNNADWVCEWLLPRLEAEGLRVCIDFRDFRLGAPVVKEMERAVMHSRYTLCILSPAYLESDFTELENVMAQHVGLESSQRRMLCLMREWCEPRLGMRALLWLDMTRDDEFDANVVRLAHALREPPDA